MPVETETLDVSSIDTTDGDITDVGIELEYPVASGDREALLYGDDSSSLRREVGTSNPWHPTSADAGWGQMTRDHVGAEITSPRLSLHSDEPETWYSGSIERAEELGYPFAPTGYGYTNFGLHHHLSDVTEDVANEIEAFCAEPWTRVFFCTSVRAGSIDPWRHGGVAPQTSEGNWAVCGTARGVRGRGTHYEFRLPEPMPPEQHELFLDFLRRVDLFGIDNAREFVAEKVVQRDERLAAIRQYKLLRDQNDDFPSENGIEHTNQHDQEAAEFLVELMGDA
jgi:hypothetical protein